MKFRAMGLSFPAAAAFAALWASIPMARASDDTVSLVLIKGEVREDWPDRGVVGVHRLNTDSDLAVTFTLGGTSLAGTEYTAATSGSVIIPQGDREAWLEFVPTGAALSLPPKTLSKTIVVTLQSGPGYAVSTAKGEQAATIMVANGSPLPSDHAAVRFLQQAAFGGDGDLQNVKEVMSKGFDKWITDQFARPVGLQQPIFDQQKAARHGKIYGDSKVIAWWNRAMSKTGAADPLRQRVGFALSEIMVISDSMDTLGNQPSGMLNYFDTLLKGAFGNYRDLLYQVGTHPCMGTYLSHLQNTKGDPVAGTFADENFAREIMQLFSIGLWELNMDGSRVLDASNQPIPTYDNTTIANMARVMTGFSFGGPKAKDFWDAPENWVTAMRMWDEFHDVGAKTLLRGLMLPARTASSPDTGTAGLADYQAAIDCLFNHSNLPPFVSKQLIQKLVTSNPSPEYVARVAGKFVNNGSGIRGDLKAVIRAILLDPEARDPQFATALSGGKLKEPYLRTANLVRGVGAKAANGIYSMEYLQDVHFMQPLSAPSVFNFFKPGFAPDGPISDAGLVAPEFQIVNAVTALSMPNYYLSALEYGFNRWGSNSRAGLVLPQFTSELALVDDVPALLRRLDLVLTGGSLPKEQHQLIREAVSQIDHSMWEWKLARVRMAVYLIASAPEFAVLK